MSYEIRGESIKTFITSGNIKLPRFQRKQTWDHKKNFELIISVFKDYPIGVSILSVNKIKNGGIIRWLLDGRQRRNALVKFYEDPENVYLWAYKYLKLNKSDQVHEPSKKFWEEITNYLEEEEVQDTNNTPHDEDNDDIIEDPEAPEEFDATAEKNAEGISSNHRNIEGLDLLFQIIKVCHNKTNRCSGFTAPFDFERYVSKLPYVVTTDKGTIKLSSKHLKIFIENYKSFCNMEGISYDEEKNFLHYIHDRNIIKDENKFKESVHRNWAAILERIDILQKIDDLLTNQTIGLIEVKNLKPSDSQKIFNLINSKGSPLKAVEILSARPKWNLIIKNPSAEVVELSKQLYKEQMGIVQENVVRWDLAATFLRRIKGNVIFKNFEPTTPSDFEKELTTAFKVLSGIYVKGVTKDSIEQLSDSDINWETDIDSLVYDIKNMIKVMESFNYFRFFKSWKNNLMDLTADGIAMNFLILIYKDWLALNKPIGTSMETKKFQKNCFILWDKLIYEYLNLQWKGSSDSKTHNNIISTDPIEPISKEDWLNLLKDIYDKNSINGNDISRKYMDPLLYHFYCLNSIGAPDTTLGSWEVDHIMPQALFNNSQIPKRDIIQNSIYNLALLPKTENSSKGKKRLSEMLGDDWMVNEIEKYELIPKNKFIEYSDISNYSKMFEERKKHFDTAFDIKRTHILNN